MEPTQLTTDGPNEAQLAALGAILTKHADPEPAPVEAAGDADPDDEVEETPEAAELPASEETEPEEGGDKPAETEGDDEEADWMEEARQALQLDGWRLSDLKNLSKASLQRMGKAAAKRQADVRSKFDSHSAEIGTLKQKLESVGKSEAEPGNESPGQPASANLSEIAKRFAEVAGIEQRDAEPILAELGTAFTAPLQQELKASRDAIGEMFDVVQGIVFDSVKSSLLDRFPQAATEGGVDALKKALSKLNPKAYSDLPYRERARVMMEEAAEFAFKEKSSQTAKPKVAPKRNQPSLPGAKTKPHRLDPEAAAMDTWKAIERKHGVA